MSEIKKICAFDIGIKNLSYCILDVNEMNIIRWELIHLQTQTPTCTYKINGNETCGKESKMKHKINIEYFCTKHAKLYTKLKTQELENIIKKLKLNEKNKCEIVDKTKCHKNCTTEINMKKYCEVHGKKICNEIIKNDKLINVKKVSCMKESLSNLGEKMYDALDKRPEILQVDKIVIENQPSQKNPTMKSISILLLSYFIMKKYKNVDFIAPSGKLKVNEKLTKEILGISNKNDKYAVTKELGIKYTEKIIQTFKNSEIFCEILKKEKKQDDLCDAFLHAYYHSIGSALKLIDDDFSKKLIKYFQEKKDNKKKRVKNDQNTIKIDC